MTTNSTQCDDERKGLPSASVWRRLELCPGSWALAEKAKELGQEAHVKTEYSEAGDRIHARLAGIVDEDGQEIALSAEEAETADILQERATEQVQRIFGDEMTLTLNEKRLWMFQLGKAVLSGRFDRVIYTHKLALVQDFKSGFAEPDAAEQNAQLRVLAVLTALALPEVAEIVVQIVSRAHGVTEGRYGMPELLEAYNGILATLDAIKDERAPLVPGAIQCRYCPALNICEAVKSLIIPFTQDRIETLPDGAEAAWILDKATLLAGYCEEVKNHYKDKMNRDDTYRIPGYEMVPGAVKREVTDWPEARKRLAKFISDRELDRLASYGFGELETALGRALGVKDKKLRKQKLMEVLGELVSEKQNASSLKRVSGKPTIAALADSTK